MRLQSRKFLSKWRRATLRGLLFRREPSALEKCEEVTALQKELKEKYPQKTIWLYTDFCGKKYRI